MSTTSNPHACICLDSSVVIADTVKNQGAQTRLGTIEKHRKKLNLDVYLPPTVRNECLKRITQLFCYVGETLRNFEHEFRNLKNDSGILKDVTLEDLTFIQDFFEKRISSLRRGMSEYDLLRNIEALVVNYLTESLDSVQSVEYAAFVTGIAIGINKISTALHYELAAKVSSYKITTATINQGLLKTLESDPTLKKIAKKPNDLQIICEVEAHQRTIKKWSILTTLDKNDFLDNSARIETVANVVCADPLYLPRVIQRLSSKPI
ncbi:MAG: hypothetical protein AUH25_00895 [Thaumarchaeota archaeon 13_1_40CM_38_12]|nr:MAG: hypothetical protein AUH25_00895 [Thaumarchaeota archaeon 13_1_40CM_38_12]OLC34273.1 MAG: hypothetical protein AUH84_05330 [Thaumarchaeota archaeon 13_1_40CM_4_38_7]